MINCKSSKVQNIHTCVYRILRSLVTFASIVVEIFLLSSLVFWETNRNETETSNLSRTRKYTLHVDPISTLGSRILRNAVGRNCPARSAPPSEIRKMLPIRRKRALTPLRSKYAPVGPRMHAAHCPPQTAPRTLNRQEEAGWRWRDSKQWSTFTLLPNRSSREETSALSLAGEEKNSFAPGDRVYRQGSSTRGSSRSDRWNFDDGIKAEDLWRLLTWLSVGGMLRHVVVI